MTLAIYSSSDRRCLSLSEASSNCLNLRDSQSQHMHEELGNKNDELPWHCERERLLPRFFKADRSVRISWLPSKLCRYVRRKKRALRISPILRTTESIYEFPNIAEVDDVVEVELLVDRAKTGVAHLADGRLL